MKNFFAPITKIEKRMNYYTFEVAGYIVLIQDLDKILLELFKTPLREVMPIVYTKLISQNVQEAIYKELIFEQIINDAWTVYNNDH